MPALVRVGGETAGARWIQLVPSHSHVSLRYAVADAPPKSTCTPRVWSNAITLPKRGPGAFAGVRWVQLVPSHSQVSLLMLPGNTALLTPPNIVTTPRMASDQNANVSRGEGLVAGARCVHAIPSKVHVSLMAELVAVV